MVKKCYIKRIGRQGKINILANKKLRELWDRENIQHCEFRQFLPDIECITWLPLQNCHRNDRYWYRKCPELLSDISQVARGCQLHHNFIDTHKKEKEEIFKKLRG